MQQVTDGIRDVSYISKTTNPALQLNLSYAGFGNLIYTNEDGSIGYHTINILSSEVEDKLYLINDDELKSDFNEVKKSIDESPPKHI